MRWGAQWGFTTRAGAVALLAAGVAQARRARPSAQADWGLAVESSAFDSAAQELRALQDLRASGASIAEEAWAELRHDLDRGPVGHLLFQVGEAIGQRQGARGDDHVQPPDEWVATIFSILLIAYCAKVLCMDASQAAGLRQQIGKRKDEQQKKYYKTVQHMVGQLEAARETSARLAQLHFQEKYRGFMRNLNMLKKSDCANFHRPDFKLFPTLKGFYLLWMKAFETCSIEPETQPLILCPQWKLEKATTVHELMSVISEESKGKVRDLAGENMQEAKRLHQQIKEQHSTGKRSRSWLAMQGTCGCSAARVRRQEAFPLDINLLCFKITILSSWHAWLLGSFLFGLTLAILEHAQGRHIVGLAVDLSMLLLVVVLCLAGTLDETMKLELEITGLESKTSAVEGTKKNIEEWVEKYERVTKLWQFHTMNMLDLFNAMDGFTFSKEYASTDENFLSECAVICTLIVAKCEKILEGMGPPRLYLDRHAIDDEYLQVAARQLEASISKVADLGDGGEFFKTSLKLDNMMGIIYIHVTGARKLPNLDAGLFKGANDLTDAFVILRMGDMKLEECPRTEVVQDSLNPTWDEDFIFETTPEAKRMSLEVYDSDMDRWRGETKKPCGFATLDFRCRPGEWVKATEKLHSFQDGQQEMEAVIEVEYCFVECIAQLVTLQAGPPGSRSRTSGRKSFKSMFGTSFTDQVGTSFMDQDSEIGPRHGARY